MSTTVRSHCKINLGLAIGPTRPDGFHGLATLYQTLALHDWVTVQVNPTSGSRRVRDASPASSITLTSNHPGVPTDHRNTAWKMVELALERIAIAAEVHIHIEKSLPVQGGMGAGSANAAAALLGLERELAREHIAALPDSDRLALAAAVGSDVPLFLIGGAVLGTGHGEQVRGLRDFASTPCVVAVPETGVSTPLAFRDWDARYDNSRAQAANGLTSQPETYTLEQLSRVYSSVLGFAGDIKDAAPDTSGIAGEPEAEQSLHPGTRSDLAEESLLALVRTGIENDFEEVVFPQYPLLREIKRELMGVNSGAPATYAALSGSGSALFGLYRSQEDAQAAQQRIQNFGCKALLTETLPRREYWKKMFAG